MKISRYALVPVLMLSFATLPACDKKEEEKKVEVAEKPKKEKAKEKKPKIKLPHLAPDAPKTAVGEVAVPAELEEEAARTVAIENLEAELDRLEAEIHVGE